DVRVPSGLGHEEINHRKELQATERLADEVAIGQRNHRVKANQEKALDAAVVDRFEQGNSGQPGMRNACFIDVPDLGDVCAMRWVFDVAGAWQLVTFLALLPRALAVALPGDHGVAASFPAD